MPLSHFPYIVLQIIVPRSILLFDVNCTGSCLKRILILFSNEYVLIVALCHQQLQALQLKGLTLGHRYLFLLLSLNCFKKQREMMPFKSTDNFIIVLLVCHIFGSL